jgi:branched-chain amino acid transport system permease protein
LLEVFSADSRRLQAGAIETASFPLLEGVSIGLLPLLSFVSAVAVIGVLQFVLYRTALGRAFRATADDPAVAQLMGLDNRHIFGLAMALSLAVVAVAGVLLAVRTNFDPAIGPARLIFGFEAVIIGGLGSLWGTLLGGIALGVAQAVGAKIDPGWQMLAGHLVFLLVLAVRPEGLFPKVRG